MIDETTITALWREIDRLRLEVERLKREIERLKTEKQDANRQ